MNVTFSFTVQYTGDPSSVRREVTDRCKGLEERPEDFDPQAVEYEVDLGEYNGAPITARSGYWVRVKVSYYVGTYRVGKR